MHNVIDLIPVDTKRLTPDQYIAITPEERRTIDFCRFVPPAPGDNHFGYFFVKLRNPTYYTADGQR